MNAEACPPAAPTERIVTAGAAAAAPASEWSVATVAASVAGAEVRGAVELHRRVRQARAGRPRGVDPQVALGQVAGVLAEAEQGRELGAGPEGDQVPAALDPLAEGPDLGVVERAAAREEHDLVRGEQRRCTAPASTTANAFRPSARRISA